MTNPHCAHLLIPHKAQKNDKNDAKYRFATDSDLGGTNLDLFPPNNSSLVTVRINGNTVGYVMHSSTIGYCIGSISSVQIVSSLMTVHLHCCMQNSSKDTKHDYTGITVS